jgi:hypothetical protein
MRLSKELKRQVTANAFIVARLFRKRGWKRCLGLATAFVVRICKNEGYWVRMKIRI